MGTNLKTESHNIVVRLIMSELLGKAQEEVGPKVKLTPNKTFDPSLLKSQSI